VLSCINVGALDITAPNLVVALAYGYGGLIQLLAGMWEMAVGNTFGATALSSYGGFWISFGIILTPAFGIVESYTNKAGVSDFHDVFALYLYGCVQQSFRGFFCPRDLTDARNMTDGSSSPSCSPSSPCAPPSPS